MVLVSRVGEIWHQWRLFQVQLQIGGVNSAQLLHRRCYFSNMLHCVIVALVKLSRMSYNQMDTTGRSTLGIING